MCIPLEPKITKLGRTLAFGKNLHKMIINKYFIIFLISIPVMDVDEMVNSMGRRKKRSVDDWEDDSSWEDEDLGDFSFDDDFTEGFDDVKDFSVTNFYPDPYCQRVQDLKTECFQESILELWANKGVFDETSDADIAGLTKQGIINKINSGNFRYIDN